MNLVVWAGVGPVCSTVGKNLLLPHPDSFVTPLRNELHRARLHSPFGLLPTHPRPAYRHLCWSSKDRSAEQDRFAFLIDAAIWRRFLTAVHRLVTALRTLADKTAQRTGWTLELALPDDDIKLGEEVEIALFRVAQESLTNVAKYACASSVSIALALDEERVSMHIADDGVGIRSEDLQRTRTHGLLGMRQRVSARGGRIEIERRQPHGTDIRVTMPRVRNFDA